MTFRAGFLADDLQNPVKPRVFAGVADDADEQVFARDRVVAQLGQQTEGFDLAGRFHMRAHRCIRDVVADADMVFVGRADRNILGNDGANVGFQFLEVDPGRFRKSR